MRGQDNHWVLNLSVVALGERKDVDLAEFWKLGDTWSEVGDKGMCIWPYSILIADFTANHICCRLPANQGSHINGALLLYQPMQSNQLKRDRTKKFPQLNYISWFGSLDRYLISSVESTVQMCQRKKRQNTRVVKVPSINHPSSIDHQHQWSGQGQATNGPNTTRAPKQHLCERNIRGHNTHSPHVKIQFGFVECKGIKQSSFGFEGVGSCDCNFSHRSVLQAPPGGRESTQKVDNVLTSLLDLEPKWSIPIWRESACILIISTH